MNFWALSLSSASLDGRILILRARKNIPLWDTNRAFLGIYSSFLKYDQNCDDNNPMKTLKGLFSLPTFLFLLFILSGCMPDSLTKFKEAPPVKKSSSSGGSSVPDVPTDCTAGDFATGGGCTSLTGLDYTDSVISLVGSTTVAACGTQSVKVGRYVHVLDGTNSGKTLSFSPTLSPSTSTGESFTVYSISPSLPTGASFSTEAGTISVTPTGYLAETTYTVVATHVPTGSTACYQLQFGSVTQLSSVSIPQPVGQKLILTLDKYSDNDSDPNETPFFTAGNTVTAENGAKATINYLDKANKQLHVTVTSSSTTALFADAVKLDGDSTGFGTTDATISQTVYAFADPALVGTVITTPSINVPSGLTLSSTEKQTLTFDVSPAIPAPVSLDTSTVSATFGSIVKSSAGTSALTPTKYTLSVTSPSGTVVSTGFRMSVLTIAAPKPVTDIIYPQNNGDHVILKVGSVASFTPPTKITGKVTSCGAPPCNTITGTSTNFTQELTTGSRLQIANREYTVASIASATSLTVSETINSSDVFSLVDAKPLNMPVVGQYLAGTSSTSDDIKNIKGLVKFIDSSTNELYVQVVDNNQGTGTYQDPNGGGFQAGYSLYPGVTFLTESTTVDSVEYVFDATAFQASSNFIPVVLPFDKTVVADQTELQTLTFKTLPELSIPNLNFDPALGNAYDVAAFTASADLPETSTQTVTVSAKTINGKEFTKDFKFRIQSPPSGLGYTRQAIITVSNTNSFVRGNFISAPIAPPQSASEKNLGRVLEVLDSTHLYVDVIEGKFEIDDPVDNRMIYGSERSQVSNIQGVSLVMLFDNPVSAPTVGERFAVNAATGYDGSVVYQTTVNQGGVNYMKVYAKLVASVEIQNGDSITFQDSASTLTVARVIAKHIKAKVSSNLTAASTSFIPGVTVSTADKCIDPGVGAQVTCEENVGECYDSSETIRIFTATTNTACTAVSGVWKSRAWESFQGVVSEVDITTDELILLVNNGYLSNSDNIDYTNVFSTIRDSIDSNNISAQNMFTLYRGDSTSIKPDLETGGTGSKFQIAPDLPEGLTLDEDTGIISGIADNSKTRTLYTVNAINGAGSRSFSFYLQVHNAFEIIDQTAGTSFSLHKAGKDNFATRCRVTQDQIDAASITGRNEYRDIDCRIEVGELDLYQSKLSIQYNTSAGVCNHLYTEPYRFYNFQPRSTNIIFTQRTGDFADATCGGLAEFSPFEPACLGDYTTIDGPNCDIGEYTLNTIAYTLTPASCSDGSSSTPAACADNNGSCAGGLGGETTGTQCTANGGVWTSTGVWTAASCSNTTETETVECGGEVKLCREGAVMGNALGQGGDVAEFISAENGTKASPDDFLWEFDSPISRDMSSNRYLANYTRQNKCVSSDGYTYQTKAWQQRNKTTYINDVNEPMNGGNPYYTFSCLDAGSSTIARINLQVREWDLFFKFNDKLEYQDFDSNNSRTKMDGISTAGHATDSFGDFLSDYSDWDDVLFPSFNDSTYEANGCVNNALTGVSIAAGSNTLSGITATIQEGDIISVNPDGANELFVVQRVTVPTATVRSLRSAAGTAFYPTHSNVGLSVVSRYKQTATGGTVTSSLAVPQRLTLAGATFGSAGLQVGDVIRIGGGTQAIEYVTIAAIVSTTEAYTATPMRYAHTAHDVFAVDTVPFPYSESY